MRTGVLLAAGESSRMGQSKPLLDWNGEPLAQYQVRQMIEAGLESVVVVLGHEAEAVATALASVVGENEPRVVTAINEAYAEGKVGSVLCGLRGLPAQRDLILVLSVDQPRSSALLNTILVAHESQNPLITVPRYRGRGGHPTIFSGRLYSEMLSINEGTLGLRAVVQRHRERVRYFDLDDPSVVLDINDPASYTAATGAAHVEATNDQLKRNF
jgi:molybdenum cofactor cytidylyltransferase